MFTNCTACHADRTDAITMIGAAPLLSSGTALLVATIIVLIAAVTPLFGGGLSKSWQQHCR